MDRGFVASAAHVAVFHGTGMAGSSPVAIAIAVALSLAAAPAQGKQGDAAEGGVIEVSLADDVPVTITLLGLWITFVGLQDGMTSSHCGWCSGPGPVDRAARSGLLADDPEAAAKGSDVLLFSVMPAAALLTAIASAKKSGDPLSVAGQDLVIVVEAFLATALATQWVKTIVRRPRPYLHYGGDDPLYGEGSDSMLSFFSGHTSLAASLAASTATLALLRGRKAAPWIAVVGAALALSVGLLRVAADKHYLSDVLAGFAVGTAVGIVVPLLHVKKGKNKSQGESVGGTGGIPFAFAAGPGSVSVFGTF